MKMVVGLGNPGTKYEGTRHNVGFDVLAELSRRWGTDKPKSRFESLVSEIVCGSVKLLLIAPQTYMNLSGRSVQQFVHFYQQPLADVLVVCDDLNLKVGQLRLRSSGSAGGQKGLASILACLGSEAIPRLRIGIGRPQPDVDSASFVLSRFSKSETESIDQAIVRSAAAIEVWAASGIAAAMNQFNGEASGGSSTVST